MTNSASTPIEDLVGQLVPPGMKVLHLDAGRSLLVKRRLSEEATVYEASPTTSTGGWDIVVAVDVFRRRYTEEAYSKALTDILGALKPGGALIVYERNPYEDVEDNPPGTLARGIAPIANRPEISNAYVLGQEFFEHWCAAFWTYDAPLPDAIDRFLAPRSILRDRDGDEASVPVGPGVEARVRIVGWRDRAKIAVVERVDT